MNSTVTLYKQFHKLASTTSRLEKESLLQLYKDDEQFKFVLEFLLNGHKITGISTKKVDKSVQISYYETESGDYWIEDLLNYFNDHNTGTDDNIAYVQFYTSKLAEQDANDEVNYDMLVELIYDIVTKSLKLGVDVKTVQKVYGKDFIKTLDVMLGTSIEHCNIIPHTWISISRKLNGTRCFYYKGHLYSRQNKEFINCEHIVNDLNRLSENSEFKDYVFDGELLLDEEGLSDSENFQKGTGIAMSKSGDKSGLKLVLFDLLPTSEFDAGMSTAKYVERKHQLIEISKLISELNLSNVQVVEFVYEGNNTDEIWKALDYAEKNDWEGVMIDLNSPYECKRTKNLIKVKKFYTYDLLVTGVEVGTGRNVGRLGAVVVQFKGNEVRVGSGFSDEQRIEFWKNPDLIVGRVIEVKYKEVTKNKNGTESLQFPVFMQIREEGKEPSLE